MDSVIVRSSDGGERQISGAQVKALHSRLGGALLRPGDTGYDEARQVWNGMIDRRPALIARCETTGDVVAAIDFARTHQILLSVRGGGHNIAGLAVCDGGLMIDLSPMRRIEVDPTTRRVVVEPGATLGDVDRATEPFGLVVPGGIISTTGIAGLTLGGGFGWLTRKWGCTADLLRAVEIVTADGRVLRASSDEHPDLFWGLRGGGGNFGVVTRFEFEALPLGPTVVAGLVFHTMDRAPAVMRLFREFTKSSPDELTSLLVLRRAPAAPFLPPEVHGQPVVGIVVCYAGPVDEGLRAVEPIKQFGEPVVDSIKPKPFREHQSFLDGSQPHGLQYYWKSSYLPGMSDGLDQVLRAAADGFTSPKSSILVMHLGGAAQRVDPAATAAAHRDANYIAVIQAAWDDPSENDRHIRWARETEAAVAPSGTGGVYVNFMTADEVGDQTRVAHDPSNHARLVAVKTTYDPTNLFRQNRNIKPAVPVAEIGEHLTPAVD